MGPALLARSDTERPLVLLDGDDGVLVLPAATATAEQVAFVVRHSSGVLEVPVEAEVCERLRLPPMPGAGPGGEGRPAYTVSVDAAEGITTGISAADRARTARLLGSPGTRADQLSRPGHVLPVRVGGTGGFGTAEAAVALVRSAGLPCAALAAAVTTEDGRGLAGVGELRAFAEQHGLRAVEVSAVLAYERERLRRVEAVVETRLPTRHGRFRAVGLRSLPDGGEHLALVNGELGAGSAVLAVVSECPLGDVFGSTACGCRARLDAALAALAGSPGGVVVYLRAPEGAGLACPPAPPAGLVDGIRTAIGLS